jgi:hypothetical protein
MKNSKTFPVAALLASLITFGAIACAQSQTLIVYATPVVADGNGTGCPGKFSGYATYELSSPNWGWAPATNTTTFTASDGGGRTDTRIEYIGEYGDTSCDIGSVTIPNPPMSPEYIFDIYFPSNTPTTNYPIVLNGFVVP